MKRNRPQSSVTHTIDNLQHSSEESPGGVDAHDLHLQTLTEQLRVAAARTATDGAVVAGLAEDQVEFIRASHFGATPLHGPLPDGMVDHLGISDSLHEWVPGTALLVIAMLAMHKLRSGESRSDVINWVKEQAMMAGVANGVATIVSILTGHELVRLPAALMTRFWIARADVSGVAHRRTQDARARFWDQLNGQMPATVVCAEPLIVGGP